MKSEIGRRSANCRPKSRYRMVAQVCFRTNESDCKTMSRFASQSPKFGDCELNVGLPKSENLHGIVRLIDCPEFAKRTPCPIARMSPALVLSRPESQTNRKGWLMLNTQANLANG
jgi:hypothetical protein